MLVRIQGAGYAVWVDEVLPVMAKQVMNGINNVTKSNVTARRVDTTCNSGDYVQVNNSDYNAQNAVSSTPIPLKSPHNAHHLLDKLLLCAEEKANYQGQNEVLKNQVAELSKRINDLTDQLIDRESKLQVMMTKIADVNLLEFELDCERKLIVAKEKKFEEERNQLLLQIQNLTQNAGVVCSPTQNMSYRDALCKSVVPPAPTSTCTPTNQDWKLVKSSHAKHPATNTTASSPPTPTSNRFAVFEETTTCTTSPSSSNAKPNPTCINAKSSSTRKPLTIQQSNNAKPSSTHSHETTNQQRKPNVVIIGDSISKRIEGQKLSRSAEVSNFNESGRRVEQVCKDVLTNKKAVSNADSVIVHVGTNNLKSDSLDDICAKFNTLVENLKSNVSARCEIAFSSLIHRTNHRTDNSNLTDKTISVNVFLQDMCDRNKWTFIDNTAVKNLSKDNLHPDKKGMSFLARNFQDFLRCAHPHLFRHIYQKTYPRNRVPPVGNRTQSLPPWMMHLVGIPQR
jgi:lysophospholipase L1-like esterase